MDNGYYFLFALLIVYCATSLFIFIEKLIYFSRCTYDSDFSKKQPALWKKASIQDLILTITFTWLPVLIIKTFVDNIKRWLID